MNVLDSLRDVVKYSEPKELAKYLGIFAGVFCLIFGLLIFMHYRRVHWYTDQLKQLDAMRKQTSQILRDSKLVKAQQQEVEEILSKDKDFRIGEAYQSVVWSCRAAEGSTTASFSSGWLRGSRRGLISLPASSTRATSPRSGLKRSC